MKIQPLIQKLNESREYKDFTGKNKDAFMVAGFFIIDFEMGKHVHQIDYYIPSTKKVAAFTLDEGIKLQMLNLLDEKAPEQLDMDAVIDLDELHGIVQDEMKNRSITSDIKKMIAVIQNIKGKKVWNINCILSGMELLRAHVEDNSRTVLSMDKLSMTDIMKKLPMDQINAAKQAQSAQGQGMKETSADKIKKLEILEKAIEKEKQALKKATKKSKGKKSASNPEPETPEPEIPIESEEE